MRKPRDIDAELKALADKQRNLKQRKVIQLGELVVATGADRIDAETLAGVLLDALDRTSDAEAKEAWRARGEAFFRRERRARSNDAAIASGSAASDAGRAQAQ